MKQGDIMSMDEVATTTSSITAMSQMVACGCNPRASTRRRHRHRRLLPKLRKNTYHEAIEFEDESDESSEDGFFYFDAEEDELGDSYYPLVLGEQDEEFLNKKMAARETSPSQPLGLIDYEQLELSQRYYCIVRTPIHDIMQQLTNPRVRLNQAGYPGSLTPHQLDECRKFLQGLPELRPAVAEQIYSLRDVEEPAFTICRWVRATKWDAHAILKRCDENQPMFDNARENHFFPDPSKAMGAPFTAFLSQYPMLPIGRGKSGCTVNYFGAGRINPEGILALTSVPQLESYFWWSFMHKMKSELRKVRAEDPNSVRCEGINIIDLNGLSSSALSSETMQVIKMASKISDFFPETLNCMLVINAPAFFGAAWGLIKKFIDPQTARRIRLFSNKEAGMKALQELVDIDQIPKDYGGNNKSIAEAFLEEANDPTLVRQEIELIHVKRKHTTHSKKEWLVKEGESMEITCYTRSASAARITVMVNGGGSTSVNCQMDCTTEPPKASNRLLVKNVKGPSFVSFEVHDLDNATSKHHKQSRGYFLIVGDVRVASIDDGSNKTQKMSRRPSQKITVSSIPKTPIEYDELGTSERFNSLTGAPVQELMRLLTHPRVCLNSPGYPGCLTPEQLAECQKFLTDLPESIHSQIWSLRDVIEPAYIICRWVRATKWDAAAIIKRCQENQPRFEAAEKNHFFPDPSEAIGAPYPVFLTQYPFLPIGRAKNGSSVSYFQAGQINPEGVLTMTTLEQLEGFFWWGYMHQMKEGLRKTMALDPDYVRGESITVIDLTGLNSAALSSETMACIQLYSKIGDYFPETLNQMLILNAPGFFSLAWGIIKQFIDPQTASRIKLFSSTSQGMKALKDVVDDDQLPRDYGGGNKSFEDAMRDEANDPSLMRQVVELLHVKNKGVASSKKDFDVKAGQVMELKCYTRSVSSATVIVYINGEKKNELICQGNNGVAFSYSLAANVEGPANVTMEIQDHHNSDRKQSKMSRGYFLIVGDMRKPGGADQGSTSNLRASFGSKKQVSTNTLNSSSKRIRHMQPIGNELATMGRAASLIALLPAGKEPMRYDTLELSERYLRLTSGPVQELMNQLTHPRVRLNNRGFPGSLTPEQLEECYKFLTGMPKSIHTQIWSLRDVLDPAYIICRWVRATKWDADAILLRCQENQPRFEAAQRNQFFPDPSQAIGAPYPVFLTQYPFLPLGRAKNGSSVSYFQAGHINPEGVLTMTTLEQLEGFFWWGYMHQMKDGLRKTIAIDHEYVRCENITVIDLHGLNSAALSSETMACIKLSSKIGDYFPESLNQMLILNAPGFFSLAWGVIKKFLDPQTAARIKLFSNKAQGLKALQELVDDDQLPRDYGGGNKSFEEVMRHEANDPTLVRQVVELIHVKNKGVASSTKDFSVKAGQVIELKCYTRSVSGANVAVSISGKVHNQLICQGNNGVASCHNLAANVEGPATITVEVQDLHNADKKHSKMSKGYFLIAADIRTPGGADERSSSNLEARKTSSVSTDPSPLIVTPVREESKKLLAAKEQVKNAPLELSSIPKTPISHDELGTSERFKILTEAPLEDMMRLLTHPRVCLNGPGYPGCLTPEQLAECQKFLTDLPKSIHSQIWSLRDVIEPAYIICRWVRATKWDAAAIIKRCQENQPRFEAAEKNHFFPDPSQAIGAPYPVFLTQYPFLPLGRAKNGSSVSYFQAGHINPEGVLTMTTLEQLEGFFWWGYMHQMKEDLRRTIAIDPDYVRGEGITVIDLQGLSSSALSSETMACIQLYSKIGDYFPETLNQMLILNAPGFFSLAWGIIKKFIDPQTASRIKLFSNKAHGLKALKALVDDDQLPSDYGGGNKSFVEAMREEANDPFLLRQTVELLHVKRKGKVVSKKDFDVKGGEFMELKCYTRSVSGATVLVVVNGQDVRQVGCQGSDGIASCHVLAAKIIGPSSVSIEVLDLDNAEKKHHKQSRGHFLIVGDFRRPEGAKEQSIRKMSTKQLSAKHAHPERTKEDSVKKLSTKYVVPVKEELIAAPEMAPSGPMKAMQYDQIDASERFYNITDAPVQALMQQLSKPRVVLDRDGYPGRLTKKQLDECQKFLKNMPASIQDQIWSFRDVEEPAFTVCRWVRAMKWDADAILKRCEANQPQFENAKRNQFFPDPSKSIGAPFPVYLSQYPFLPIGRAKNGCSVNYLLAGKINPEGILALTTVEDLEGYFWWNFMHKMKSELRKTQAQDPDFVRCEGVNIIDLQGLSRNALSSETMQVIKLASKISDFFPETLNCMLILNAPGFFGMAWGLIKKFIDPQTARRIQLFSNKEAGIKALQELVDINQIPKDYGGRNKSIAEAFLEEANDPNLLRQEIELIYVRRKGSAVSKKELDVQEGEYIELKCYTRSCSAAAIVVVVNKEVYGRVENVCCDATNDGHPKAACHILANKIKGPCTVSLEVEDLDNANKKHNGHSRGYFLTVGDIRPLAS